MSNDTDEARFIEDGSSVIFPRQRARHHVGFIRTYEGLTIPQARRKMKRIWAGHSLQDDMIHYLKHKRVLK